MKARLAGVPLSGGLLLLAACGGSPAGPRPVRLAAPFDLRPGETVVVADTSLRIGFSRVSEDSRCPIAGVCVWEGDAVASITAAQEGRAASAFELHTNGGFARHGTYGGYRISLEGLAPYPKIDQVIPPASYVATLVVDAEASAAAP